MLRVSLLVMQANEVISLMVPEYTSFASVFKDSDYPVSFVEVENFSTSAGTDRSSGTGVQRSASPEVETKEVPFICLLNQDKEVISISL